LHACARLSESDWSGGGRKRQIVNAAAFRAVRFLSRRGARASSAIVAVFGHVIKAAAIGDEKMPSDGAFNDSEFGLDIVHGHGPGFAGAAAARFGASFFNSSIHRRTISQLAACKMPWPCVGATHQRRHTTVEIGIGIERPDGSIARTIRDSRGKRSSRYSTAE